MAQVAIQQAALLAKNLKARLTGGKQQTFRYKDLGSMATIGRNRAVAEIGKAKWGGFTAWLLWLVVHLRSILSVRNKVIVLLNWIWNLCDLRPLTPPHPQAQRTRRSLTRLVKSVSPTETRV